MYGKLVSIIIPVYNVEKYLRKCLDSVVNQTYKNLEIILVDDGSIDSSGQICDEYSSIDLRIKVIHKENEGVALARLMGFENSTGELITFIDADDYVDLCFVDKLIGPFEKYDIDLCVCGNNTIVNNFVVPKKRTIEGYLTRNNIHHILSSNYLWDNSVERSGIPPFLWTKLVKRKYVKEALLYGLGLWWGEDQIASFHIMKSIQSMYVLKEMLYNYVKHDNQVTKIYKSDIWENQFECWRRFKELDNENLLIHQLPIRMWWTVKQNFNKMSKNIYSYKTFKREMRFFENNTLWLEMLNNKSLPKGKRENLAFFLLGRKLYYPFYKLLLHRL